MGVGALPSTTPSAPPLRPARPGGPRRRQTQADAGHRLAAQLVSAIAAHRAAGRSALLEGDLDRAWSELWAARDLEFDLDQLSAVVSLSLPADLEMETDLIPLARALSSRSHPRAADTWRRVLEDGAARSIQAEAAEWLARHAFGHGQVRLALRILHAGGLLGRPIEPDALRSAYRQAGIDPGAAFAVYLGAARLDLHSARASGLRDPLTDLLWVDQDPRWWRDGVELPAPWLNRTRHSAPVQPEHQREALRRARDLVASRREEGWLLLAEGDFAAGPTGPRVLGRNLRTGCAEPADHELFVQIRMAYEDAADRLPDVAWPWYRLAELLAWTGFPERAREHLAQAERRRLGDRKAEHAHRQPLRALVQAGLGEMAERAPVSPRPFPATLYGPPLAWRLSPARWRR